MSQQFLYIYAFVLTKRICYIMLCIESYKNIQQCTQHKKKYLKNINLLFLLELGVFFRMYLMLYYMYFSLISL